MALSANAVKRLMVALGDAAVGREVADAIDQANAPRQSATPGVTNREPVDLIVATNVSQTVDFASLKVGDYVMMVPAVAGNSDLIGPIAVAGDLGQAAVVGNAYQVWRQVKVPAARTETF